MPFNTDLAATSPEAWTAEMDRYREEMRVRNLEHCLVTAQYGGGVKSYFAMLAEAQRRLYEAAQRVEKIRWQNVTRREEGTR